MANSLAWINAGAAWTPLSEASLSGWYKADSIALADGTPVDSWLDSSLNGLTSTASGATRPVFHTGIKNGLPAVLFNSANSQFMTNAVSTSTKPWTVAGVIESSNYAQNLCILGTAGGNSGLEIRVNGAQHLDILKQGAVDIGSDTTLLVNSSWYIFVITYDGSGNFAFTVNGVAGATGTNNQTFSNDNTQIGQSTGENFDGYIAEIMKFAAIISVPATTVDTYLNNKWAVH